MTWTCKYSTHLQSIARRCISTDHILRSTANTQIIASHYSPLLWSVLIASPLCIRNEYIAISVKGLVAALLPRHTSRHTSAPWRHSRLRCKWIFDICLLVCITSFFGVVVVGRLHFFATFSFFCLRRRYPTKF